MTTVVPAPSPVEPTADTAPPPVDTTNVLLVLIDDLTSDRIARFGIDGAHSPQTPVMDSLADEGRLFSRAYVAPLCSPMRASLLTGRLPSRTGVGIAIFDGDHYRLADEERTLAEALKQADPAWSTGAFGKWHLASLDDPGWPSLPNEQGFDEYDGTMKNVGFYSFWRRTHNGVNSVSNNYVTRAITDRATAWIQRTPEPWFAYVAYQAAHEPLHVPPDGWRRSDPDPDSDTELLDAMVESIDIGIGQILDGMDPAVRARTWVIVLADNGTTARAAVPPNAPDTAKGTLFEGGIRVPLIIAGPGIQPGDTAGLASMVDLFPTILELTGTPLPTDRPLDGESLVPLLHDPAAQVRTHVYQEIFTPNRGMEGPTRHGDTAINATHKVLQDPELGESVYRIVGNRLQEELLVTPDPAELPSIQALRDVLADRQATREALWGL